MNHYGKNSILCGDLDYLCLLCDARFRDVAEVQRHIRWEPHRKLVKNVTYVAKYRGEYIIMIKNNYFCEICNILLPTTMKTNIHIKEEMHLTNKENQAAGNSPPPPSVKRNGMGSVIIDNKIVVTENQWNGIIDEECILCEETVENVDEHMQFRSHVITLAQARLQKDIPGEVYRKVGNDIFYCFTCKEPLPITEFDNHWSSKEHDNKKNKLTTVNNAAGTSKDNFSAEFRNNLKNMFDSSKIEPKNATNDVGSKLDDFLKEGIDINLLTSKATCKKCNFSPVFTVKAIQDHIAMHKQAETFINSDDSDDDSWTDATSDSEDDELSSASSANDDIIAHINMIFNGCMDSSEIKHKLAEFGKKNHIKLVNEGSKGHCTLCNSYISAHIKNFKQHVQGAKHIAQLATLKVNNTATSNNEPNKDYETVPLKQYLKSLFFNKHMDDYWINRKLSVDQHSFVGVSLLNNNEKYDKFMCFVCDEVFPKEKDTEHCRSTRHRDKLFETKVITTLKRDFVREIRPGLFHCGFCNITTPGWLIMQRHLKSQRHRDVRNQQQMVSKMTHDTYGPLIPKSSSIDADICMMRLFNKGLL